MKPSFDPTQTWDLPDNILVSEQAEGTSYTYMIVVWELGLITVMLQWPRSKAASCSTTWRAIRAGSKSARPPRCSSVYLRRARSRWRSSPITLKNRSLVSSAWTTEVCTRLNSLLLQVRIPNTVVYSYEANWILFAAYTNVWLQLWCRPSIPRWSRLSRPCPILTTQAPTEVFSTRGARTSIRWRFWVVQRSTTRSSPSVSWTRTAAATLSNRWVETRASLNGRDP